MFYLRNVKKGFATNSSSYHSTITGNITVPEEIWLDFKLGGVEETHHGDGVVISGYRLKDDNGVNWNSYDEMSYHAYIYESIIEKDGQRLVDISLEYSNDLV